MTDQAPQENPNPLSMSAFTARADEGPVVMVNLLKFKPDGGRDRYMEYGAASGPLVLKVGGRPIFGGNPAELLIGAEDHKEWDLMILVEYPKRQCLIDMVSTPEYQAIAHLRTESLERSVLYAIDPLPNLLGAVGE